MGSDPRLSPDGLYYWDGQRWLPTGQGGVPATATAGMVQYSSIWRRAGAWIVDYIVVFVANLILGFVIGIGAGLLLATGGHVSQGASQAISNIANLVAFIGTWLYWALLESSPWQATLGKRLVGVTVVDYAGNRISFLRATGRFFAKFISSLVCLVGWVLPAFTARKQALHDFIASTYVVRQQPSAPHAIGAPEPTNAAAMAAAVVALLFLLLVPILVIVILLTMGGQIKNVFSNVVVALNS